MKSYLNTIDPSEEESEEHEHEPTTTVQPEEPEHNGYPSSTAPPIQCPEWKCPGEEVCFGVADRCDGRWACNSGYDESGCQRKKSSTLSLLLKVTF